jgi:hypothetical protein
MRGLPFLRYMLYHTPALDAAETTTTSYLTYPVYTGSGMSHVSFPSSQIFLHMLR